jgi:transcriptional antiterminator RfaH
VKQWFAVMTKPRAEALGREHLERQGFEVRLPRVRRERRGGAIEPLFPRYLFLRADPSRDDLARVRSTRGICGLVRFGASPATVPAPVIDGLDARTDADGLVRLDPPELRPGAAVRIADGPLAGLQAVFAAEGARERVELLVGLLGAGCRISVPLRHLAATL